MQRLNFGFAHRRFTSGTAALRRAQSVLRPYEAPIAQRSGREGRLRENYDYVIASLQEAIPKGDIVPLGIALQRALATLDLLSKSPGAGAGVTYQERGYQISSPLPPPDRALHVWRDTRQCRRLPGLRHSSNHARGRWQRPARA